MWGERTCQTSLCWMPNPPSCLWRLDAVRRHCQVHLILHIICCLPTSLICLFIQLFSYLYIYIYLLISNNTFYSINCYILPRSFLSGCSGTGNGSFSAIGKDGRVQDESFVCDFGNPLGGIVGYSTSEAHSIGSQFFITLGPCAWMTGQFVGIGRVIQGFETLRRINLAPTTNQRPNPPIIVSASGKEL